MTAEAGIAPARKLGALHAEQSVDEALVFAAKTVHLAILRIAEHGQAQAGEGLDQETTDGRAAFAQHADMGCQAVLSLAHQP